LSVRPQIYLDMDGVLVDWDGGVAKLFGMPLEEVLERYPDKQDRYERIVRFDPDFYDNLEWLPGGRELWAYLRERDVILLTAYSRYVPRGADLKRRWALRELSLPAERVLAYQNKWEKKGHAVAEDGSPNLLIDDEPRNVEEWIAAGGVGILHRTAPETIEMLRNMGI
jgi:hypothetical protein